MSADKVIEALADSLLLRKDDRERNLVIAPADATRDPAPLCSITGIVSYKDSSVSVDEADCRNCSAKAQVAMNVGQSKVTTAMTENHA